MCLTLWESYNGIHSANGAPVQSADLADCIAQCESDQMCFGADYDTSSDLRCWLHFDQDDFSGNNTFRGDSSVTQFRKITNCFNATGKSHSPSNCRLQENVIIIKKSLQYLTRLI